MSRFKTSDPLLVDPPPGDHRRSAARPGAHVEALPGESSRALADWHRFQDLGGDPSGTEVGVAHGCHGKKSWDLSKNHGNDGKENHGKIWKSWENHGKVMGKSWENHGKIMGESWENHGNNGKMMRNHVFVPLAKWWENYGKMMETGELKDVNDGTYMLTQRHSKKERYRCNFNSSWFLLGTEETHGVWFTLW